MLIIDVIVATIAAATAEVFAGETAGYMTMHIVTVAFFYPQLVIALKQAHDLNMSNRTIYAWLAVGWKSCVRPVYAAHMAAGPDVIRRSGPYHFARTQECLTQ